jgi:hypothetical protein
VAAPQRDRHQERAQAAVAAKAADRRRQRDEDVVHQVLGRLGVADEAPGEALQGGAMLAIDLVDRCPITLGQAGDQRGFAHGFRLAEEGDTRTRHAAWYPAGRGSFKLFARSTTSGSE